MLPDVGTDLPVEELERLPKREGYDYELDEGRLRIVAAPAMRPWHEDMAFRVTAHFRARGQVAFPEPGIVLRDRTTRTPTARNSMAPLAGKVDLGRCWPL